MPRNESHLAPDRSHRGATWVVALAESQAPIQDGFDADEFEVSVDMHVAKNLAALSDFKRRFVDHDGKVDDAAQALYEKGSMMSPAMNSLKADDVYATDGTGDSILLRIERARLAQGLSVQELADRAGINIQTLRNFRASADPKPTINVVEQLAEAVGLKLVLAPLDAPAPGFSDIMPPNMALLLLRVLRRFDDGIDRNARAAANSWLTSRLRR